MRAAEEASEKDWPSVRRDAVFKYVRRRSTNTQPVQVPLSKQLYTTYRFNSGGIMACKFLPPLYYGVVPRP